MTIDQDSHPNIVMVTIDSLRADHCGFMGYEKNTTPMLDRMANEGMVFSNAYAPGSRTPHSLPSMFTGEYPDSVLGHVNGMDDTQEDISGHIDRHVTIQDQLSDLGYETAGFTPNPWTSEYFGFGRGFDHYQDFMDEDRSEKIWERMIAGRGSKTIAGVRLLMSWLQRANTFKAWEHFYDNITQWISEANEPYFVWVFLLDVHFPYLPDQKATSQSRWRTYEANLRLYLESQQTPYSNRVHDQLVTAYDDSIRYTDRFLERIASDVQDAVIVTTADHGEAFGEHGTYGHHDQLYKQNVHVPLVIWGNGPGETVSAPFSLRLLPELLNTIAIGGDVATVAKDTAGSIASGGDKLRISGKNWRFIQRSDGDDEVRLTTDDGARVDDLETINLCRRLLDGWMEHHSECGRIKNAIYDIEHHEI
ncbi:sulfatase [Halorientalis pallida]|nr:sulfatase [Halorientalis pallida]